MDQATAKDLDVRYRSSEEMIADLEEALAVETARAGGATGEATTVLRTLPEASPAAAPRFSARLAVGLTLLAVGAAAALVAIFAVDHTRRGTGPPPKPPPGLRGVPLGQLSAHDYDPEGTGGEHHPDRNFVVDSRAGTAWSTETYTGGTLNNKSGVGIYVDAAPGVAARVLRVSTPTPGFAATIYGAQSGPPAGIRDPGWVRLAAAARVRADQRFALQTHGQRYRYYLVWITKLPPMKDHAEISEIALFK